MRPQPPYQIIREHFDLTYQRDLTNVFSIVNGTCVFHPDLRLRGLFIPKLSMQWNDLCFTYLHNTLF